jgi:hypothetical protein
MKNELANSVFTVASFAVLNKKPKNPEGCQISLVLQVTWFFWVCEERTILSLT